MLPYYIVFFILLLGVAIERKSESEVLKKRALIFEAVILIVFFGFRGYIGYDWYTYNPNFKGISLAKIIEKKDYFEFGFKFYTLLIKNIFNNYTFYTLVGSLIDIVIICIVSRRYSKSPLIVVFLFFSIYGLALEIDMLRNAKAIVLFLLSIKYIEERKLEKFIGLIILAFTFHASSLIYLPMYFILGKKWNKKIVLGIFILGNLYYLSDMRIFIKLLKHMDIIIPTSFGRAIMSKLSIYFSSTPLDFKLGFSIFYFERLIIFVLAWVMDSEIRKQKYGDIMLNSLYISIFIFLYLAELSVMGARLNILFIYSYWFVLPLLFNYYSELVVMVTIIAVALFRLTNQITFDGTDGVYAYQNMLLNAQPIEKQSKKVVKTFSLFKKAQGREISILF